MNSLVKRLIDAKAFLTIDFAYAKTKAKGKDEELLHALLFAMSRRGHLCIHIEDGINPPLTELTQDPELIASLEEKIRDLPEGTHHLPKNLWLERAIASQVQRLIKVASVPPCQDKQEEALKKALAMPLTFLTGGPGTGKTTTAARIIDAFPSDRVIVAAPTGKAASHIEKKIPGKASTLHALLDLHLPLNELERGKKLDADLIIIDEASMIDPILFCRLLYAVPGGAHLVLMGDANQLSAVEGGSLFADLIESPECAPVTTLLTHVFRSDRKEILDMAASILDGKLNPLTTLDFGFQAKLPSEIYENLWDYLKDKVDTSSFQLLSTLRKGPLGVDALNDFFHKKCQETRDTFPILITKNDPRTGLSNGDIGRLIPGKGAQFGDGKEVSIDQLPPFEWAYCLSVHKSQGSEYDEVLVLVPEGSESFGREVLYTAVTRAKNKIDLDGVPSQIEAALGRSSRKASTIIRELRILT